MKPGMQRDLLVAYWLLFDELAIANRAPAPQTRGGGSNERANSRKNNDGGKPRAPNNKTPRGPQKSSP